MNKPDYFKSYVKYSRSYTSDKTNKTYHVFSNSLNEIHIAESVYNYYNKFKPDTEKDYYLFVNPRLNVHTGVPFLGYVVKEIEVK